MKQYPEPRAALAGYHQFQFGFFQLKWVCMLLLQGYCGLNINFKLASQMVFYFSQGQFTQKYNLWSTA